MLRKVPMRLWEYRLNVSYPAAWYYDSVLPVDGWFEQEMLYFEGLNTGSGLGFGRRDLTYEFPSRAQAQEAERYFSAFPDIETYGVHKIK